MKGTPYCRWNTVLVALLPFLAVACSTTREPAGAPPKDRYENFAELAAAHQEGLDFEIRKTERRSGTLIMAIHGGDMERGTTELAQAIASTDLDYYSFVGRGVNAYETLHLTSTNYDEPRLLEMLTDSTRCMSLHGYMDEAAAFCVGGANSSARSKVLRALEIAFPHQRSCELCCKGNTGVNPKNIVNRCREPGVQIEISPTTRDRIVSDREFRERLAKALRSGLIR